MSKLRLSVMVVGPFLILVSSLGLTRWARSDAPQVTSSNIVVRGQSPATVTFAATKRTTTADPKSLDRACATAAKELQTNLGTGCAVIVHPPFVVGGDMSQAKLEKWYAQTISPAATAMASSYFRRTPDRPITVLLFGSQQTYDAYAEKLFGDKGISVYGYYKPRERTLVMNIATGGGTLVHELTHALIDFDFPDVPDWFNEGLASLHEQCRFREGPGGPWIEGLENWRLPALQQAVRRKQLRTLSSLIQSDDFRGQDVGINYAQARYFCMYLQRKQLLAEYFKRFHAGAKQDPRGYQTVMEVLPDRSWSELDREFNAWVLTLAY